MIMAPEVGLLMFLLSISTEQNMAVANINRNVYDMSFCIAHGDRNSAEGVVSCSLGRCDLLCNTQLLINML